MRLEMTIAASESQEFARLSGDYNPLHIDAVAARRTQYGSTVVHGIHAVLRTMDEAVRSGCWKSVSPQRLAVSFHNAIRAGAMFTATVKPPGADGVARIAVECEGLTGFTLVLNLAVDQVSTYGTASDVLPLQSVPHDVRFPPDEVQGAVPVSANRHLVRRLFPNLGDSADTTWIADLLASTRIVGMEMPGLHSIFGGLRLVRRAAGAPVEASTAKFVVERVDPRFRSLRLKFSGSCLEGDLETFFRPVPAMQEPFTAVAKLVAPDTYAGQHALVVGGSRGIGETISKVLAAGGARVTLTYAQGRSEAEAVRAEIERDGRPCCARQLDVTAALDDATVAWLASAGYTHVYFLASPRIEKNGTGQWRQEIFDRLCKVYVHGLARVVDAISPGSKPSVPARWFIPSSVFLDTREPGFAEYCAAKAAGESLALHLQAAGRMRVEMPRLPRMRTDQTSALVGPDVREALPVMIEALRNLAG